MSCDRGRLIAYRDGVLSVAESEEMGAHLASCSDCRAELSRLEQRSVEIDELLDALDPAVEPDSQRALAEVHHALGLGSMGAMRNTIGRFNMGSSSRAQRRWKLAIASVAAVAVVAVVFSFAPAREVAADFLSIFRVQSFEVVPVDETQQDRLDSFAAIIDEGGLLEPEFLREPSEPVSVEGPAEASDLAGFDVRVLTDLPEDVSLVKMEVATGPHMRFEADRQTANAALVLAGITDVTLPDIDTFTLEADIRSVVVQEYTVEGESLTVVQSPDPLVELPPGVPPEVLGRAYLQFLGVPTDSASVLAAEIDWTSTFVLPMPEDDVSYHEVEVDGSPALLLRTRYQSGKRQESMLLWQKDGVVCAAGGTGIASSLLVRAAEALQ